MMKEETIKTKTIKGIIWSAIDNTSHIGASFLIGVVLARLLTPDDYGLIGIITIFTTLCTTIINGGFNTALVRKKNPTDDDYATSFIINLGLSILLYAIIFICSPLIAEFFKREELILLTRVSSCTLIIGAFSMVQRVRLIKRIDFKTQTKITLIACIVSGLIGISMALLGMGVWALVFQGIILQLTNTVFLCIYNKWIPKLCFNRNSFNELFGFGWKIMTASILSSICKELQQLVIGKFYSPSLLGQYTRAKQFSMLFSNNLTNVIQRVTFPVLSDIQDDKERLVNAYRRIIKTTMLITFTLLFTLGAISEPLIYCLIGEKWYVAATYLPLLCIVGSISPIHSINVNMLQVQGRSDLILKIETLIQIISFVPLIIGAFAGIFPMLYAFVVTTFIGYNIYSYCTGKQTGYTPWMQIKDIAPSFFIAMMMAIPVYFFKFLPITNWLILPIQITFSISIFVVLCKVTDIDEYKDISNSIKRSLNKIVK